MDNIDIVTKSVEISKALLNTNVRMHKYDLEVTTTIGDIARFSIALRKELTKQDILNFLNSLRKSILEDESQLYSINVKKSSYE